MPLGVKWSKAAVAPPVAEVAAPISVPDMQFEWPEAVDLRKRAMRAKSTHEVVSSSGDAVVVVALVKVGGSIPDADEGQFETHAKHAQIIRVESGTADVILRHKPRTDGGVDIALFSKTARVKAPETIIVPAGVAHRIEQVGQKALALSAIYIGNGELPSKEDTRFDAPIEAPTELSVLPVEMRAVSGTEFDRIVSKASKYIDQIVRHFVSSADAYSKKSSLFSSTGAGERALARLVAEESPELESALVNSLAILRRNFTELVDAMIQLSIETDRRGDLYNEAVVPRHAFFPQEYNVMEGSWFASLVGYELKETTSQRKLDDREAAWGSFALRVSEFSDNSDLVKNVRTAVENYFMAADNFLLYHITSQDGNILFPGEGEEASFKHRKALHEFMFAMFAAAVSGIAGDEKSQKKFGAIARRESSILLYLVTRNIELKGPLSKVGI